MTRSIVFIAGTRWESVAGTDRRLMTALGVFIPVLWVDPPFSVLTRRQGGGKEHNRSGISLVAPGVTRLQTRTWPGASRPGIRCAATVVLERHIRSVVRRLRLEVSAVIVASPRQRFPHRIGGTRLLYVTDDWLAGAALMGLSTVRIENDLERNVHAAHVTAAVSPNLAARLARDYAVTVEVLANGCDPASGDSPTGARRKPIAGLIGQLNERLDPEILEAVRAGGTEIIVVGPRAERTAETRAFLDRFLAANGVTWHGEVPQAELPKLLGLMGVGLTPYADTAFNRASFPLKTLEYLAAGLPVVSTDLPAVQWLDTDLIEVATDPADFAHRVRSLLSRPDNAVDTAMRLAFAREHSWNARALQLLNILDSCERAGGNKNMRKFRSMRVPGTRWKTVVVACAFLAVVGLPVVLLGTSKVDSVESVQPASVQPVVSGALALPRIPWEGGPAYWDRFERASAAGWSDPNFFPIISWFGNFSSDAEVQYDKSLGINTYSGMWEGTPYHLFADNGVFWIGNKLNSSFSDDSANWVGRFLDDEVDGRFSPTAGPAHLQAIVDGLPEDGRFKYANFTQMVVAKDLDQQVAQQYVNRYTDVVSVDMYWYTIPYCDSLPYRDAYLVPVEQANCRSASSYGKILTGLTLQDAADGDLQPRWAWVENLNGGPPDAPPTNNINPGQLKGAVASSIIHEARGIAYFNQSLGGSCQAVNVFRQSQVTPGFCGNAQVGAVKEVNAQIHALAGVINTQSYDYSFGAELDTMLKSHDGYAYVFAMIDGSSMPGTRTFTLPPSVHGSSVTVLDEGRSLPVDASGQFRDTFAEDYSYHVYRVNID